MKLPVALLAAVVASAVSHAGRAQDLGSELDAGPETGAGIVEFKSQPTPGTRHLCWSCYG
ncbi:MAG: hypothetical protein QGG36_29180 [Pirellulaceae bacterium]|nr:hypothetical protein [Pirellulaceae bacterium]MDP7019907.1 hypothetical protein [Pirellulaceae bacterium]